MRDPKWYKAACVFLGLLFLCNALIPFAWVTVNSLKSTREFYTSREERTLLPKEPTLDNYRLFLRTDNALPYYFRNSAIVSLATIAIMLACAVLGAYAFARFEFAGKEKLFILFLGIMMVPGEAVLVSLYEMLYRLNLLNTLVGLILPTTSLALPTTIFILRGVFERIPRDLEDAARIDGCGPLRVLWSLIIPNSQAGIAAVIVLTFLHAWNDFGLPLVLTSSKSAQTLTVGIALLKDQYGEYELHQLCAVVVLALLPTAGLFLAAQKTFVRGIMSGAVKE